tara:strand:- start:407 stop:1012 length:606 start_codon:yes stop_codon:yes gene_type:complete
MYSTHAKAIALHGLKSPDGMVSVIRFTLCTIQQPLSGCLRQIEDIEINGIQSKYLFGSKREGLKYAIKNKEALHQGLLEIKSRNTDDLTRTIDAVYFIMQVPSLGMVKASFVLQMLGFNVACLDSHNLKRLGLDKKEMQVPATLRPETKIKKITKYVKLTRIKGTEFWWDSWCDYVAGNIGNRALTTGEAVSEFHVQCVIR